MNALELRAASGPGRDGQFVHGFDAAFAAGRLVEREQARRLEARAELPKAWRRLDRAAQAAFG